VHRRKVPDVRPWPEPARRTSSEDAPSSHDGSDSRLDPAPTCIPMGSTPCGNHHARRAIRAGLVEISCGL
jgi:hypothetical protein